MSAIHSNPHTAPKVNGLKSIKTTSITLRPVNASSTSGNCELEFSNSGNCELVFHVPAYANSYISPKQIFLSMIVTAACGAGASATTFKFNPGYPVFNRIQIKTSSGAIICDIDDYHFNRTSLAEYRTATDYALANLNIWATQNLNLVMRKAESYNPFLLKMIREKVKNGYP